MDIKANDQVMVRKKLRNGTLVKFGEVVKLDGDKASVHLPHDHKTIVVSVKELEKTSTRFGQHSRVQGSPIRRSM